MSETKDVFWEFSIKVWRNEDLRQQLLNLQEKNDLDINLCLFLLWSSTRGLVLNDAGGKIRQIQDRWLNQTIKPIRKVRVANQHHPELKQRLLEAELEAEKLYGKNLCEINKTDIPQKASAADDKTATLKANLESYTKIVWEHEFIALMIEASQ